MCTFSFFCCHPSLCLLIPALSLLLSREVFSPFLMRLSLLLFFLLPTTCSPGFRSPFFACPSNLSPCRGHCIHSLYFPLPPSVGPVSLQAPFCREPAIVLQSNFSQTLFLMPFSTTPYLDPPVCHTPGLGQGGPLSFLQGPAFAPSAPPTFFSTPVVFGFGRPGPFICPFFFLNFFVHETY